MAEYSFPEAGASFPLEYLDPTKVYGPVMEQYLLHSLLNGQIPPEIKAVIGPWIATAKEPEFEECRKYLNDEFLTLASSHPAQPVNILTGWANGTQHGQPAAAMLNLWLTELLALKNPSDNHLALARKCEDALNDRSRIWDTAYQFGRAVSKSRLSVRQTRDQLNKWLSDHVASHLWGLWWLHKRLYPQSVRTEPTAQEQRDKASMKAWETMPAEEAVRDAELEEIFGDKARQLPGYNPDHPLANKVKIGIESPNIPAPGTKAFSFVIAILPLVIHHHWSLVDIANCMEIACPRLAIISRNREAKGRDARLNDYIGRHILGPMGLRKIISPPRRRAKNSLPRAYGSAYLIALYYQNALS